MTNTRAVLREKLTFSGIIILRLRFPFAYLMQEQNNTLRRHALGKFGTLLHALAKDPAMLLYLNNQENKKITRMKISPVKSWSSLPWASGIIQRRMSRRLHGHLPGGPSRLWPV
jgi:hypothetical protein